jgi:MEMO1 family protein
MHAPPQLTPAPKRGTRFSYTYYLPSAPPSTTPGFHLSRHTRPPSTLSTHPIHASITALDREALSLLTLPRPSAPTAAATAHDAFSAYLARTSNTICGRHPVGVLFGALAALERECAVEWVRYAQSSQCETVRDSSVSYASAYVTF